MTNEEIAQQVTALWQRVGRTEMALPSHIGSSPLPLDEEVYLLCQRLVSQAYEEAAAINDAAADKYGALADSAVEKGDYRRETKFLGKRAAVEDAASDIRALKDQLVQEPVSSLP